MSGFTEETKMLIEASSGVNVLKERFDRHLDKQEKSMDRLEVKQGQIEAKQGQIMEKIEKKFEDLSKDIMAIKLNQRDGNLKWRLVQQAINTAIAVIVVYLASVFKKI